MYDFSDRKIIVTGGSSGVGRATAILLSQLGAKITVIARRAEELQKTLSMLDGSGHTYQSIDLSDFDVVVQTIRDVVAADGVKLDGVAHCAGAAKLSPLRMLSAEVLRSNLLTNLYPWAAILKCAASRKLFNPGAAIVGISSNVALRGEKGNSAYGAAKAAMNGLTKTAALELQPSGIRVNTICPAGIDTAMIRHLNLPQEQMLSPQQVANMLAFYLHPCSEPVTGMCIALRRSIP